MVKATAQYIKSCRCRSRSLVNIHIKHHSEEKMWSQKCDFDHGIVGARWAGLSISKNCWFSGINFWDAQESLEFKQNVSCEHSLKLLTSIWMTCTAAKWLADLLIAWMCRYTRVPINVSEHHNNLLSSSKLSPVNKK